MAIPLVSLNSGWEAMGDLGKLRQIQTRERRELHFGNSSEFSDFCKNAFLTDLNSFNSTYFLTLNS